MDEGRVYALYFLAILFNYGMKLKLERGGKKVPRNNIREGIITGVSLYLLYQSIVLPRIVLHIKVIDIILGISALAAGAIFFLKDKNGQSPDV